MQGSAQDVPAELGATESNATLAFAIRQNNAKARQRKANTTRPKEGLKLCHNGLVCNGKEEEVNSDERLYGVVSPYLLIISLTHEPSTEL